MGAIQIGTSIGKVRGLLLLKSRVPSFVLGISLILGSIIWFFLSEDRNISDINGGLDANTQAVGFFLGSLIAMILTLIISSIFNSGFKVTKVDQIHTDGIESLYEQNYFSAIKTELAKWNKNWNQSLSEQFSDLPKGIIYELGIKIIARLR